MASDPPKPPDVTDEMPTLRERDKPASEDRPTLERPAGKVILAGAAADDAVPPTPNKTEPGDAPKVAVPAGQPVTRTLPSSDEEGVAVTAPKVSKTAVLAPDVPDAVRPTVVTRSKPQGSAWIPALGIAAAALAVLAGGGFLFFYFFMRPTSDDATKDDANIQVPEAAAKPTETPPAATPTSGTAAPTPTAASTEAGSDTSSTSTSSGSGSGTKPTATSTTTPPGFPSGMPSWIPTAIPTALPTTIPTALPTTFPTTFPFPTSTSTTPTAKPTSTTPAE